MERRASAPAYVYNPTDDSFSSSSSSRLSTMLSASSNIDRSHMECKIYDVTTTKYSSEFPVAPRLRRLSLSPDAELDLQKPWEKALNMHMKTAMPQVSSIDVRDSNKICIWRSQAAESPTQEDLNEHTISNAWKNPYPTSWIEMGTDSEGEELIWDEDEAGSENRSEEESASVHEQINANQTPEGSPRRLLNTTLIRTKEIGARPVIRRTRSQTVPQHAQETYAVSPPSYRRTDYARMEYLHLADRGPWYNGAPLARIPERAEETSRAEGSTVSDVVERARSANLAGGVAPQWTRSSIPSKVTFLPTLKRSSSSMRSLESFWDQKFGRSDPQSDTALRNKGKGRKRDRIFRSSKRPSSLQEESIQDTPEIYQPPQTSDLPPSFSTDSVPTAAETAQATYVRVFSEDGTSISFGRILSGEDSDDGEGTVKTIVCFIRHFLCPMCQDYMYSIGRNVDPEELKRAGLRLVIVGNGDWQMIKGYRRIFKLPYPIYTDPTATLYTALGMTLRTLDPGPKASPSSSSSSLSVSESVTTESETYVRHRTLLSGISLVLRNAMKARMPIWRYMGDKELLGGEFIFVKTPGKDVACVWAHRMRYTTGHEQILNVVGEAENTTESQSCTVCSQSFATAMSSLSELSSLSGATSDRSSIAREIGFLASSSEVNNTDLAESLRDYASTTSRNIDSVYSMDSSQTSSTSTWRKIRDKELWLTREKGRWGRIIGSLGKSLDTVEVDSSEVEHPGVENLSHHLEVDIPQVVDTRNEEDIFKRWFAVEI
ncbi:hypothetical protein DFJ43DRAFT_306581 [Lentinula guzmanii]|uniref:Uncharacterized protein n=1 Tax=Lentinula guzmanii TaxID=2804957 RepID=A0AA38MTY5_9AGAR|nr:hypothetical protein DFJ43DRAFT_306581 [Lentinula guzmanii]